MPAKTKAKQSPQPKPAKPQALQSDLPRMLTIEEVATRANKSARTIKRWVASGDFPPPDKRSGRTPCWSNALFLEWFDAQRYEPNPSRLPPQRGE